MHDDIAGRYRLEERIGSGGMAEVWRAVDARTGTTVAVKRLHPGLATDPDARARFRREIEAARSVAHPAAVRVLDANPDDEAPWLVMEHVAGGSLADRLGAGVAMPTRDAAHIGADVAAALAALHAAGIVHRDVTPSNILLPPEGGARLADFGIARTWDGSALEDVTLTGDLVGTLRFVAPEVLAGEPAAPAADVWALGAVVYEAVTGQRPFDASSPTALLASQRTVPPMDGIDPTLAPLLGRMLDPDPGNRPAANTAATDLVRIAHAAPGGASDPIPEEGTVVMASAVPSRAAGVVVEPVDGSTPPSAPQPAPAAARRPQPTVTTRGIGMPAPAVLAVGLLLLAAVVLGASAFGGPRSEAGGSVPPAVTVEATQLPTITTAPDEQGSNTSGGKGKDEDKDKGKGNGKGNGNGD